MSSEESAAVRSRAPTRAVWTIGLALGALVTATVATPTYGEDATSAPTGGLLAAVAGTADTDAGTGLLDDGHGHDHTDPVTKNAISRADATGSDPLAVDPTTAEQAAANREVVARRRDTDEPELLPGAAPERRRSVPQNRYAMAGGCYALYAPRSEAWVQRAGDGFAATASGRSEAEPFHFQATTLGKYLLFGSEADFLAEQSGPGGLTASSVRPAEAPGATAVWKVTKRGSSYRFTLPASASAASALAVDQQGNLVLADRPARFRLRRTGGCAAWPEVEVNVTGRPHRGETPYAEVRGYADAHTHQMAFEFLGGRVHCGRTWHPYGVTEALKDCEDHTATDGKGAVLESFLSGDYDGHDPVGWPTFRDWPAPHSLTHEGTYHRWMERAWRGGLRLFVNLLVENNKLCQVYPLKKNSCDEMESVRLQAKRMRQFERYVDAQFGGPRKGWYRIVEDPFQARRVINQGKLAVVMGIETSVLFGCTMKLDVPECTKESIEQQLDQVHRMGVRQMELVNKFDNALSGVAGDAGSTGVVVNSANFLETGSFWDMETCPHTFGEGVHDREQYAVPREVSERDPLFGAIAAEHLPDLPLALPLYPAAPHCNQRGLTELGEFTIREMVQRKMLFDPDHQSVLGRRAALDLIEDLDYSGVLSSHSWSTPDAYPRIAQAGGFIAPYAGDSTGFVDKWRYHVGRADPRYFFGLGFGADINGLGAQGDPRGADAENPVTYPFEGIGGVTIQRQVSGERVYDINVDGVAHYGLYPDWVEDLRQLAGDAIVQDMARGSEAYLQTWERAVGIAGNACTGAGPLRPVSAFTGLPDRASTRQVLRRVGQPDIRVGNTFDYCAQSPSGKRTRVELVFTEHGRLLAVRR